MREIVSAADFLPPQKDDLSRLREAARACRGCDLYRYATQVVFGEGSAKARVIMIGEQPGDREDLAGRPFVGPAGALLDRAIEAAGLLRNEIYITNAVKHFKFKASGKRRLHDKPSARQIKACKPWLEAEIDAVAPDVIVCLGASAALSLLGPKIRVTQARGAWIAGERGDACLVTYHPSAILRMRDEAREEGYQNLVNDLQKVKRRLDKGPARVVAKKKR